MLHVKQIINNIFSSNTYVISVDGLNDYWLVDIGDFYKVLDILPANVNIKGVFLTHSHFDHIYGLNELIGRFPNCIIYTSEYGAEAIYSEKKNFSYYHGEHFELKYGKIIILDEGDKINLGNNQYLYVMATPGHCPSCLTYFSDCYIFTGDSYLPEFKVVSKLPGGNKQLALESLNRILSICKGKEVCPGHGNVMKS